MFSDYLYAILFPSSSLILLIKNKYNTVLSLTKCFPIYNPNILSIKMSDIQYIFLVIKYISCGYYQNTNLKLLHCKWMHEATLII